jgi:hypothetical protein
MAFVCKLLLINRSFYNKKTFLPVFKLVNLLICRCILIPYDEYNSTYTMEAGKTNSKPVMCSG